MKSELDHLVSSLKQKLGHCHPCLLGSNVLQPGLRAWSWNGETVTLRHMLLTTWCTHYSWRTETRGTTGGGCTGKRSASGFGVASYVFLHPLKHSSLLKDFLHFYAQGYNPLFFIWTISTLNILKILISLHVIIMYVFVFSFIKPDNTEKLSKTKTAKLKSTRCNSIILVPSAEGNKTQKEMLSL